MKTRQGYILELKDEGDGIPVEVRLRRVLKDLHRQYRLRCVTIRETTIDTATDSVDNKQHEAGSDDDNGTAQGD